MPRTHIIGAGLAGLAAAVWLASRGRAVALYEAAPQAGGRCRSFFDRSLGRVIDNGNHLLLSGNRAALAYLATIGAGDSLAGPAEAAFPFVDLATGERWTVRPGRGPLPLWLLDPARRVPRTRPADYLSMLRLAFARRDATVDEVIGPAHPLYAAFWEPLTVAALNTPPDRAAARLLWPVIARTFGRGAAACRPLIARDSLAASFVDPALAFLRAHDAAVHLGRRLHRLDLAGDRVAALAFAEGRQALGPDETVILAVPPMVAATLLPGLTVPAGDEPIVNAHFLLDRAAADPGLTGVIRGAAQWVFVRDRVASVTVSAAGALVDEPAEALAARLWADTARVLGLDPAAVPAGRIIKERRATFAQTPAQAARRPQAVTRWRNLFLAGDWTDTGLPATIEGAVTSGRTAARRVLGGAAWRLAERTGTPVAAPRRA